MQKRLYQLADWFAVAGGTILLAIVLVTTTNASAFILDRLAGLIGRDVSGLPGYEDFVSLAISSAALLFFPLCQARRGHIAVELFTARLYYRIRRALDMLWLAVTAATASFLAWWMIIGMATKRSDGAVTSVLGWPDWPFFLPGIAALILWAAIAAMQAFQGGHLGDA